jgi:hypothetical protein
VASVSAALSAVSGTSPGEAKIQRALEKEGISFSENQDKGIGVWLEKKTSATLVS